MPRRPRQPRPSAGKKREPSGGRSWLSPALACALGLLARLWAMRFEPWVTVDGTEYLRIADALARGHTFPTIFPPGYPALVAAAHLLVADRVLAAAVVSLIAGTMLVWPVWTLARRAAGPRWALLSALAVALHPALVEFSTLSMSDSAYIAALYAALALAASARAASSGLAIGGAFAMRPEALLPAAALAVRQGLAAVRAARWRALASMVAGFLVLAVPSVLYLHAVSGQWAPSGKLAAFPRAPASSWREDEARLRPAPAGAAADAPLPTRMASALRHYPANAVAHGRSVILYWPLPLLALSIWGLARRRGIESIPLLHLLAIPALGLNEQPRFVLSAIPALAILAAIPLAQSRDRRLTIGLGAVWLTGAIWCGAANWSLLTRPFDGYAGAQKQAGEWLAGQTERGPVMDRRPHLAFYANLPYHVMPELDYDALLDYAVRQRIRYLELDEGLIRVFRPQLRPLLYDPNWRNRERRVEMIYAGGHFKGYGVTVFRVLQPGEAKTGAPPVFDVRWMTRPGMAPFR